jgi:transcriptional regulator with XRE-family HTH domain
VVKINKDLKQTGANQTDAKQLREVFAQRLKEIREERGLSQEDVGKMAGVSKATISKYEAACHPPKLIHAAAIARALNVGFSYLIGFTDNRYVQETNILTDLFLSLSDDGKTELLNYARYLETKNAKE